MKPFWADFVTYSFSFLTPLSVSLLRLHTNFLHSAIKKQQNFDCTGQKFLYLLMFECKRDEIQLKVSFFKFYLIIPVVIIGVHLIYMCIYTWMSEACTLLSLAALTNIQHRRCTNPEFMSEGEQSSERGPEHWMVAIKIGATHGEPLSAGDLLCSDKMHITLILQWLWHNAGLSLSFSVLKWSSYLIHGVSSRLQVVRNVSH